MVKKEIYPKTKRMRCLGEEVEITEKLDGSNLTIFKQGDFLFIAQRNNIFTLQEIENVKNILYKGLYEFLKDYGEDLKSKLNDGCAICGEWLGMGKLKYNVDEFSNRYNIFAVAKIPYTELEDIKYKHDEFKYCFKDEKIPNYISEVPIVDKIKYLPNKENMDKLYVKYTEKVGRNVEGFVINYNNVITKYVRMKNGQIKEHFDRL